MRGIEPQRKSRFDFISRQGVYENLIPRFIPDNMTKRPGLIAALPRKKTDFPLKIEMGGKPFEGLSRLDCLSLLSPR